ncbi:peptidase M48 Ste24p [Halobacteriales archaeon QS_8_69_73]|nr:MAG: peptidase M48 Ste24p [Halobacteriales archaeon QS_8_69_73]
MLLTIALVVLLPFMFIYVFVAVINGVFLPLLEALGYGPYPGRVYVEPWLAALVVAGCLVAQARFGPGTVVDGVGAHRADAEAYPDLHGSVVRLSAVADIEPPDVAVTSNEAPNAMAVRGPASTPVVVVTTGLLGRLDEREREAVLAHEIAHLKNRDATVMTVAWLLPTATYYVATASYYLLYGVTRMFGYGDSTSDGDGEGAAKVILVLLVAAVLTLALSAMFWAASVLVHRVLSRYREYAADRGAAALTGDPAALASALRTMDETMPTVPDRDLRELDGGTEALYAAPLETRAFGGKELVSTDVFPETHPPTGERIERLREMAGELS